MKVWLGSEIPRELWDPIEIEEVGFFVKNHNYSCTQQGR